MIDPLFLVALPVVAMLFVVALLWWRRQRIARASPIDEVLAISLAYALGLVALHRAAAPLGVSDTPLVLAAAAGGIAFVEGSLRQQAARWVLRTALVLLSVFVVLKGALGAASVLSFGGLVGVVGYAALVLLVWGAAVALLSERSGARPLLLALLVGAGISALSVSTGAGPALFAGATVGLVAVIARLAAPPHRPARDAGTYVLAGALWVGALVGA